MDAVKITKIVPECEMVSTFMFKWDADVRPGQFVMVWLPGKGEAPMSLSYTGTEKGVTVENRGPTTSAMHELKAGDKLGIRGPFGNGYSDFEGDSVLLVGGGTGTSSLAPLADELRGQGKKVTAALGARSMCDMVFLMRLEEAGAEVHTATDDGSGGHHGLVTDVAFNLLAEFDYDHIIACGPEAMMVRTVELAQRHNIPIQCSLERFMKCGIGLCDSCSLDGLRVCRDGPVFDGDTLSATEDFGNWKRTKSGLRVPL